ncbi:trypsin-like serine protease [Streptomyces sp. HSW2009]|uniref:trypsin-like serine protease n=1 Tax=Streptomyces sp. HSW2009 TaxID=3142890 RepID=UPI0032EF40F4
MFLRTSHTLRTSRTPRALRTVLRAVAAPVLIAAAVLTAPGAQAASPEPTPPPGTRIVGGGQATENYSFMGSLQVQGRHGCGASLISSEWMVTAAHCVENQSSGLSVRIGSRDHTSGGTVARVAQAIPHPNYRGLPGNYDIALLRLGQSVSQTPVAIADSSPGQGTGTRLLGWGQECGSPQCGQAPRLLKQLDTRINPDGMCAESFNGASELCVYGSRTQTACYGDSGGPALVQSGGGWALVGATSRAGQRSQVCGTGDATIYTDVTAHRQWIDQTTGGTGPGPGPGPGCSAAAWDPAEYYPPGTQVSYEGYVWQNQQWSYGEAPGQGWGWQRVGEC